MRKALVVLLSVCLLAFVVGSVSAREAEKSGIHMMQSAGELGLDLELSDLHSVAAVDTYCLVWYNFEPGSWQGFTTDDMTAQRGFYFHADDFLELAGGDYGLLYPIEGAISMWCGVRKETDNYSCGFPSPPGYGNNWNQMLVTEPFDFAGVLYMSYHGVFDSEPDYDYTYIQYDLGEGNWVDVEGWNDFAIDTIATHEMLIPKSETKLRFFFISDSGWSDEDEFLNTDGACILDSITIWYDTGTITQVDYEDFEGWTVGATNMGEASLWHAEIGDPYGSYIGLWSNLQDKDPCGDNMTSQIVFFIGSPHPSASYPGLYDVPFCKGAGGIDLPCYNEIAYSPVIDMTKYSTGRNNIQDADIPSEQLVELGGFDLRYTVYRDLPSENNIFYYWQVRGIDPVTGCPSAWSNDNYIMYGPEMDYIQDGADLGPYIFPAEATEIQISVGCIDYCMYWWEQPGDCLYHTPSPWIDNVRVYRYYKVGPQWSYRDLEVFQDNFPNEEFNINTSWVRADAADDKNASDDPFYHPGDSVNVKCTSAYGIRGNSYGGEVYLHVAVRDVWPDRPGGPKPNLYGAQLQGTYGIYVEDDGSEWTILQCDTARVAWNTKKVKDQWMIDLNDSLLTRGYEVEYYFEAFDSLNYSSCLPFYAREGYTWEFTCLPTGRSDVLYVDDFHARGSRIGAVEQYWRPTFQAVIPSDNQPDVYDINAPTSMVANGLSSRAALPHLTYDGIAHVGYRIIIWDSGNLKTATIGCGDISFEKTDDCMLLSNWLNLSENDVGLLVCGDGIAYDLAVNTGNTSAIQLLSSWCGVAFDEDSYYEETGGREAGGVVSPLVTGTNTGIFWNDGSPYQLYAFGGCPIINSFDILSTTQYGVEALKYPDWDGEPKVAAIQSVQPNSGMYNARTMWFGFSWYYVRDVEPSDTMVRNLLFNEIYTWFQGTSNSDITPAEVPTMYRLAQNYPNPFNPTTKIAFDIKKKGNVSLKIYNVAGQLVKTLVDDVLEANHYEVTWAGTNNAGVKVASGVYFYSIEADNFTSTKKMVLLR